MALSKNIKNSIFWLNAMKIGIVFIGILTLISLFFNSFSDLFSGNWDAVFEKNFSNQQWIRFFSSKVIAGFIYGTYVSNKNMK
jgi:hypothetical protein